MFFVNQRWLGGLLTNFTTIQRSLSRLRDLEAMETDGRYDTLSKKEIAQIEKEKRKLQKNLEGIRNMSRLPDALFVVDTRKEKIAVDEARKLKIPVIGVVDTNCDPDEVDYVIPGNDDALRAIRLFASRIADAVLGGRGIRESVQADDESDADDRGRRARPGGARPAGATRTGHFDSHRLGGTRYRFLAPAGLRPRRRSYVRASGCQLPASSEKHQTVARWKLKLKFWKPEAGSFESRRGDGDYSSTGQEAPRSDGRGDDGVQGRAHRSQGRTWTTPRPSSASAAWRRRRRRPAAPRTRD